MNLTPHRVIAVAAVVLVLAGLLAARLSAIGFDFWNAPQLQAELENQQTLDKTLDAQSQLICRRTSEKDAIVEEIVNGRIDLVRAAALFYHLHESQPNFVALLREHYPDLTIEECLCRNAIDFTATRVEDRPEGRAVLAQLEWEFQQFRRSRVRPATNG
jgi:hypothetical protein